MATVWEVIVIGGGPAGLSAALTLGRCRRSVLVVDAGAHRNRSSRHLHCFVTRDGTAPAEFLAIARAQLAPYASVTLRSGKVVAADREPDGFFSLKLEDGSRERCRKLLIATGVSDELPDLPDIGRFYGRSVHHCPYCDGWEWRDQPLAVYGRCDKGAGLALMLLQWSRQVSLLIPGGARLIEPALRHRLRERGIECHERHVTALEGTDDGYLQRIVFASGPPLPVRALFFNTGQHQRSLLAASLGCDLGERGGYATGEYDVATCVPGLYVAGDAVRDVQLVIVAAAEGAKAAFAINKALLAEGGLG